MKKSGNADSGINLKLATDCAASFAGATGLGVTLSDAGGGVLYEAGYGCVSCQFCAAAGKAKQNVCGPAHSHGMSEAERFGGRYVYFCPMGLSCFVSPIVGDVGSEAKITVGPFLMVDREDYVAYDLQEILRLSPGEIGRVCALLDEIAYVPPPRVHALSSLLFMAVGFLNNVGAVGGMLEKQGAELIQGQMAAYILELKKQEEPPQYPIETERALVERMARFDKPKAQELLNELLGFVLFSSGGSVAHIKTRIYELLVVISRAAIAAGAPAGEACQRNHDFITRAQNVASVDELYYLISTAMNRYMDSIFQYAGGARHAAAANAEAYILAYYDKKITLQMVAGQVHLSPSHFSRVFKAATDENFNSYLNRVRIEQSRKLLRQNIRAADVSAMVGYEDQSYFTKVFKRVTGLSPRQYAKRQGV